MPLGSQCVVLGLDAMRVPNSLPPRWDVRTRTGHGGGRSTGMDAIEWAVRAVELGAGEIVANSMDATARARAMTWSCCARCLKR